MGAFDDIRDKAEGAMNDIPPEQQQKIEQIAQEKGIPLDQAREHFFRAQGTDQNHGDQPEDQDRDEREEM